MHILKILSKQRTSQIYKGFKHCNAHLHIYSHLKFKKYKQLTESHITNEEPEAWCIQIYDFKLDDLSLLCFQNYLPSWRKLKLRKINKTMLYEGELLRYEVNIFYYSIMLSVLITLKFFSNYFINIFFITSL